MRNKPAYINKEINSTKNHETYLMWFSATVGPQNIVKLTTFFICPPNILDLFRLLDIPYSWK